VISSVRTRLTLWYVAVLAGVLVTFSVAVYTLLVRTLYDRIESELRSTQQVAITSLDNDAAEGQTIAGAASSTVRELFNPPQRLTIYDGNGAMLADNGLDDPPPSVPVEALGPGGDVAIYTEPEEPGDDDLRLVAARTVTLFPGDRRYIVVASYPLEPIEEEIEVIERVFLYAIPGTLAIAGGLGWFLARRSLAPAVAMSEQARQIGAGNLDERLPVSDSRDELGRLATNFNELLDRLHTAFSLQRQFMADASHELRTPLSVVGTTVEVTLEKEQRSEAELREALEIIGEQNQRLARTVRDMFTLARADAGRYPLQHTKFYLDETIDEVVRAARQLGSRRGVDVTGGTSGDSPLHGDEDLLRQMVMNLAENAVKHTPAGGTVRVKLEREADRYVITVADTGAGIPPETQPHIFERFYRGDRARSHTDGSGGAGLGLPIARWIAEAHGGRLELAHSDAHGSTFRVTIPTTR
jgi:two-component system, OmpR family, sensor kinase